MSKESVPVRTLSGGTQRGASTRRELAAFFEPKSLAVLGVSPSPRNLGRQIIENLVAFGFQGVIVPVGRQGGAVAGRAIVPSLGEAPSVPDLAVVLVPAAQVVATLEECGRAGVRAVVVSTGGFGEYEAGRAALEAEVLEVARRRGIRVMGPNCIGVINLDCGLCTPFAPLSRSAFAPGPHSLVSQSGGVMLYLAEVLAREGLGVHILVSEGNKLDLDEADLVPHLAADPGTRLVLLYIEGIVRGRELLAAAARSPKPVIALKANVTESSAAIARSHTSALANDDRVVEGAFRQAGILRVRDLEDFAVCAKAFALPWLRGDNLVIASMSGGMSVVAADVCTRHGFRLPPLPPGLIEKLEGQSRGGVIHLANPLDLGDIHDLGAILGGLDELLGLPDVHGVVLSLPSPDSVGRMISEGVSMETALDRVHALSRAHGKPVAVSFFASRRSVEPLVGRVALPIFWDLTESIRALAWQRAYWRRAGRKRSPAAPTWLRHPPRGASTGPAWSGRDAMRPTDVASLLEAYGIPFEPIHLATAPEEAVAAAERIGYPVALKLVSPDITHKTDVGGVALGLGNREEVEAGFRAVVERVRARAPHAEVRGVGVQRMWEGAIEVIIGARQDSAFGPIVLFGLGGIWVEALGDVAVRVAPISRDDALEMIGEIRASRVLQGARGTVPADIGALANVLLAVARLMVDVPEISELDLNPVMALPRGARAVDARITVTS